MGACRLLLLGPPLIQRGERAEPITLRKGLALAAYIAVEQRAFTREYLAAMLWPEFPSQSALANLRRMLTYLRETLGGACIRTEGDLVRLDHSFAAVDLAEFQSLVNGDPQRSDVARLESAAALYRGSFLEGFVLGDCLQFDEWQDGVRQRVEEQFDQVLETLCEYHLHGASPTAALPYARRWLELDPLNEAAHRMLMEIHARDGRADLARRQFESCRRTLSREGLEPEQKTRDLFESITGHRPGMDRPVPGPSGGPSRPAAAADRSGRRRRWRRSAFAAACVFAIAAVSVTYVFRRFLLGSDPSVAAVEPLLQGSQLSSLALVLRNDGMALPRLGYAVVFSSDRTAVAPRDYRVFADEVRMRRDGELRVEVDRIGDIEPYLSARNVRIPPGTYSLAVIVDPEERLWEDSELNNRLADGSLFFHPGTAPEAAFVVDVTCHGRGTLSEANPLKLFIGDRSVSVLRDWRWASFVVTAEGRHYLPVDDLPKRDSDGSGYALLVVQDVHGDLARPEYPGPGDISAIYREGATSLSYGIANVANGTAISPGRSYRVDFSPPAPPAADAFEIDDRKELATEVTYADVPVRQRHTFHDEGTGDTDQDWYRILLPAGATITVEAFSAGGLWECNMAIDIADEQEYIRTADDKSELDFYPLLTARNETGADRFYYFQAKPWPMYETTINRFADYVIEFRR